MSLLTIIKYPDIRLKKIANPVNRQEINSKYMQGFIEDLFETMYYHHGIGLAATQVDIPLRVITIDLSTNHSQPICLINPVLSNTNGTIVCNEGCLSFPGIYTNIKRYKLITVNFLDQNGTEQSITTDDLLSICCQHEIDHLNGKTFFDHLSPLKQALLKKKLTKKNLL